MGDMADMDIGECITNDEMTMDFVTGRIGLGEAFESGVVDEHGSIPYSRVQTVKKNKTCRRCKKSGLQWMNKDGKWLLGDGINIHKCTEADRVIE